MLIDKISELESRDGNNQNTLSTMEPQQQTQSKPTASLYPIGRDGKRDFSKSPAQQASPDKDFNSDVTIYYRDVSVKVRIPLHNEVQNVLSPIYNGFKAITTCGESLQKKDLYRIKDVSGIIRPGTMTLVLSCPGEGKSTYLRALSNRIELSSGRVVYNGRDFDSAIDEGVDLKKMTQYVDQVDTHLPLLTVYETIDFAHQLTSVKYDKQRVEDAITLLGMEECRNTIIGNALIRGVSGGQKKRVTTGELLVSDAPVLFLDEFSNGLDSSTSVDIATGLKKFCRKYNNSMVCTLQQPTPELFALFDRLVVLREGQVVFDGPVDDVLPYFEAMGFKAPDDVDTADFLIDCLSQPRSVILRQKEEELHAAKKAGKSGHNKSQPTKSSSNTNINKPKTIQTTYGPINISPQPCVTTEEMIEYYNTTPYWKEIEEDLNEYLPADRQHEPDMSKFKPLMPTENAKEMYKLGYRLPIVPLVSNVVSRQFKMFIRNTATMIPRFIIAIIMALIYGSLYWKVGIDQYVLRLAAFTIAITQVAFGNFVEIPLASESSYVVKKQLAARFYPAWTYSVGCWLTSIPMCLTESMIYNLVLYFMTNAVPAAAEFFTHFAILIATSLMFSTWYRFLASIAVDEQSAQSVAGPSTGVMMVFAGLFVTPSNIPDFMIWLYWISPFSWSVRALSNNEFLSSRYDTIVQSGTENIRVGDLYLRTIDMKIGHLWILWAIIYLVGLSLIVVCMNSFFLESRYYEESIGTRRSDDQELVEGEVDNLPEEVDNDDQLLREQVQAAAVQQATIQHEQSHTGSTAASSTGAGSSTGGGATLNTLRQHLPFTPAWLSFSDVSYTVKVQKDKQTVDRILLNHVNGYAQPGKMLALMGASGAGKTTLLDVIAGLKNTGVVEGKILINGQPATKDLIASMCGYVEQFDTLFPYQTVRETLLFAARLRLPRAIKDEIKVKIVNEIIEILDLTSMQNYLIGNASIQGLSPAQCKRVNIGVELVANPSILFLDEPTTGLSSKDAQTVMKVVKRIARSGRSIICTIHQPSAELFFLFDRLLLLGAGGYQIYFGDLGRRGQGFVQYLSRCPGITPIKPRVNPASWMLVELGVGVAAEKGDDNARFQNATVAADQVVIEEDPEWAHLSPAQKTVQKFRKMYLQSEPYKLVIKRIGVLESIEIIDANDEAGLAKHQREVEMTQMKRNRKKIGPQTADNAVEHSTNTSHTILPTTTVMIPPKQREIWYKQLGYLFIRNFSAYSRNQSFIYSRHFVILILSLIFGLIYLDIKAVDVASASSLIGAIFMSVAFSAITLMTTAIPVFFESRATFYREKAAGYYAPTYWALCQLLIELIWCVPAMVISIIPPYFMVGLENNVGIFFGHVLATLLMLLSYICMAMLFSAICPNSGAAGVISGAYFSLSHAVAGVAITWPNIPKGYKWLYRLFPHSHLLEALIMPQFDRNTAVMTLLVDNVEQQVMVRDYAVSYLGWTYGNYWVGLGWGLLYVGVVVMLSFLATNFLAFNKR